MDKLRRYGKVLWTLVIGGLLLSNSGTTQERTTQEQNIFKPYRLFLLNTREADGTSPSRGEPISISDNPRTPFCAQSAFELPGQAWHVDFSAGGVTLQVGNYTSVKPKYWLISPGFPVPSDPENVRLLVIDHFGPKELPLREVGDPPRKLGVVHGALVIAHMRALLENRGYGLVSASPLRYTRGNRTITLQHVDIGEVSQDGNTDDLVALLRRRVEFNPREDLVINMSFALIPCGLLDNYRTLRDRRLTRVPPERYTFNAYLDDVATVNGHGATRTDRERFIRQIFTTVPPGDRLKPWLTSAQEWYRKAGRNAVAVASSGNFGLPFSTMPGAWESVLSVGATNVFGGPPGLSGNSNWSDVGDVTSIGEWFTLPPNMLTYLCQSGPDSSCPTTDLMPPDSSNTSRYAHFGYRGTSFSAPSVAVTLATVIRPGTCFPPSGVGYQPVTTKAQNLPWHTLRC